MFKRYFAWNRLLKHPAYILDRKDKNYFYLSITHAPYNRFGRDNLPLNTVDNYGRPLFIIPAVYIAEVTNFSKTPLAWLKFDKADGHVIRDIDKIVKTYYNNR